MSAIIEKITLRGRKVVGGVCEGEALVTRDRVSTPITLEGHTFELTDTGGYGIVDKDNLTADIERQIQLAIDEAQLILFTVDAQTGPVPPFTTIELVVRKCREIGRASCRERVSSPV